MDWNSISLGLAWIVIFLYTLALVVVFVFSATQAYLAWKYTHSKKYKPEAPHWKFNGTDSFPAVTIQLPIFNELYVIKRLLTAITHWNTQKSSWKFKSSTIPQTSLWPSPPNWLQPIKTKALP